MKIACYALAYNEELMLPHFIKHYKQFCDKIVIYDNMSTDNTKQIALDNGCEVIQWESPDKKLNDQCYIDIKSNCFKKDRNYYDWVMTVDSDEFYTHKDGINIFMETLENYTKLGINLPKVSGFNMVHKNYDFKENIEVINKAVPSSDYSKRCIFNPKINITWEIGCHKVIKLDNNIKESDDCSIILKHYKFINFDHVLNRSKEYYERLSTFNLHNGYGVQYTWNSDSWMKYMTDLLEKSEVL